MQLGFRYDVGPNVGALNRSALVASDGFVVPLAPDLFSLMALPSVGNSIRDWSRQWKTALEMQPNGIDFPLPQANPKPLGYVSQQFSVYGNRRATAFRSWLRRIEDAYEEGVLTPLRPSLLGMTRRSWGHSRTSAASSPSPRKRIRRCSSLEETRRAERSCTRAQNRGLSFARSQNRSPTASTVECRCISTRTFSLATETQTRSSS